MANDNLTMNSFVTIKSQSYAKCIFRCRSTTRQGSVLLKKESPEE